MQHLTPTAQVAAKQRVLEDALARIGSVSGYTVLPPLHRPFYRIRQRYKRGAAALDDLLAGHVGDALEADAPAVS